MWVGQNKKTHRDSPSHTFALEFRVIKYFYTSLLKGVVFTALQVHSALEAKKNTRWSDVLTEMFGCK